jgi:eukaryotic-like serine/threonine-protein kinase
LSDARTRPLTKREEPAPPGDLQGGALLLQLTFARLIGAGGMGEVWEARSGDLPGMRFAVKVVSLEHVHNHDVVNRFFGEARAAAAIDDPNIVIIHGTGRTEDGRPALVMQYIEGVSLSDMCEERGPLPLDAASKILLQSASALRAAHSRNITHRDIKPQNIMIAKTRWGRESFVVLVDFGIAKFHDAALAREIHTNTKTFLGTPGYSAPEQILARTVDAKADVYALGVVAYRILCGRPPYIGTSGMAVMNQQLNGEPFPEPKLLRPDIPRAWNDAILAALAMDPARRPTASEFAKRLAQGMQNGASLLGSLAPRIATDARGAGDVTLSDDVPTALSQLQAQKRDHRARTLSLATLLVGACIGIFGTIGILHAAQRSEVPAPVGLSAADTHPVAAPVAAADSAPARIEKAPADAAIADAPHSVAAADPAVPHAPAPPKDSNTSGATSRAVTKHATGSLTLRASPWADCFVVDGDAAVAGWAGRF